MSINHSPTPGSDWKASVESRLLAVNFVLAAFAMWAIVKACPEELKLYAICFVLLVVALNQFTLGRAWRQNKEQEGRDTRAPHRRSKNGEHAYRLLQESTEKAIVQRQAAR